MLLGAVQPGMAIKRRLGEMNARDLALGIQKCQSHIFETALVTRPGPNGAALEDRRQHVSEETTLA